MSPAATTCRLSVVSVFRIRRIVHSKIAEFSSSRTMLSKPCTRSTRPRRQTVRSTSGSTCVPVSSSTTSPPATVRLREMSPLPLTRSPCGASRGESDPASSRLKSFSRGRDPRFLRKSVRSLPFFSPSRERRVGRVCETHDSERWVSQTRPAPDLCSPLFTPGRPAA